MNKEKVLELILSTSEEYKYVLGGDFRNIISEIKQIRIQNIDVSNKGDIDLVSDFTFLTNEGEIIIGVMVKKDILSNTDSIFHEILQTPQKLTRITFISFWKGKKTKKKDILEYHIDIDDSFGESKFISKDEFHKVYTENCEELKNALLPSCELICFFDILVLSLIRSSTPYLGGKPDINEVTNLFRNSMIESIASDMCTSTESEDSTSGNESDSEVSVERKCRRQRYLK
ncbi:hypothetical protein FG386_000295 [Cryptosporidium ryanae]|uniref:uncharacterized protein n=1 Tax=Cryptosporidium ryanae TaxID=515981 RepID=UPI00351A013C|nr:hypothetical protein FG386_000295 [Cryptosporidium ryanae]